MRASPVKQGMLLLITTGSEGLDGLEEINLSVIEPDIILESLIDFKKIFVCLNKYLKQNILIINYIYYYNNIKLI